MNVIDLEKIRNAYKRDRFIACDRVFIRTEPGTYTHGDITVYCDQQDSQSWAARTGSLRTGYYWMPEYAVEHLIAALEGVHG